jgi:hypothetical protein
MYQVPRSWVCPPRHHHCTSSLILLALNQNIDVGRGIINLEKIRSIRHSYIRHSFSDTTVIFFDIDIMSATISLDQAAAGDPHPIADTVPSSSPTSKKFRYYIPAKKRRQKEAPDGTGGTRPAAKVARLASAGEETKVQEGDETPETQLTTERIMNLLKDLWSDDIGVITRALTKIGDIGTNRDASPYENEGKICGLGGHTVVFQVLEKHVGCLKIQVEGMRALAHLSHLMPTKQLLGDIGCVEVILARMEKYPDSWNVQALGCYVIGRLVKKRMKANAERVEKSGGIAAVIAAMKADPNSRALQYYGCMALSDMSVWEDYRPLIVEAGGVSAIAFVIEKYRDDPKMRKHSHHAMRILFKKPR